MIHSFISCPNEWFQVELFSRKYNEKLHFRILLFLLAIVLRCWNPVEYIQKIIISFLNVPLDEMNYGVRHIKLFKIQNQPFAGVLQDNFFLNFAKFTEIHLCRSLFYHQVASELWQNFISNFSYRTVMDDCFWKWKTFFLSKFIVKVILIFNK